jgi:hypothetical protein
MPAFIRSGHLIDLFTPPPPASSTFPLSRSQRFSQADADRFLHEFALVCPCCSVSRLAPLSLPRVDGRWSQLRCCSSSCASVLSSNRWHCTCKKLWMSCPKHSMWPIIVAQTLSARVSPVAGPRGVARTFSSSTIAADLHTHIRRAPKIRRTTHIVSTPSASSSSTAVKRKSDFIPTPGQLFNRGLLAKAPRLAAKFPHVVVSASASSFSVPAQHG